VSAAPPRRPVLAGNSQAAVNVLDLLLEGWPADDVLVLAPPDEKKHGWQPSLAGAAREREITVLQPAKVNDPSVLDQLRGRDTDLLLSVYYTQIFSPALLGAVQGPAINFHPSLLPRHRGTAPLIWAIVEGDTTTGVTVHVLAEGIDTGPTLDQRVLPIHPQDTGYSLHTKATNLVTAMAAQLLRRLLAGEGLPDPREQAGEASYHSTRDPSVNHLNWSMEREDVRNIVRALAPPLPGAYSFFGGHRVVFERVTPFEASTPARAPGMVEFRRPNGPAIVWAGDGALAIDLARTEDEGVGGVELLHRLGVIDGDTAR
jgi:UDP-4-amino-4-deoxy-L-arabinose formyltransferase/UDP-glucuronic acid dehydrogenase (UDP-4-keto-hexauronic acid decarboxylating)